MTSAAPAAAGPAPAVGFAGLAPPPRRTGFGGSARVGGAPPFVVGSSKSRDSGGGPPLAATGGPPLAATGGPVSSGGGGLADVYWRSMNPTALPPSTITTFVDCPAGGRSPLSTFVGACVASASAASTVAPPAPAASRSRTTSTGNRYQVPRARPLTMTCVAALPARSLRASAVDASYWISTKETEATSRSFIGALPNPGIGPGASPWSRSRSHGTTWIRGRIATMCVDRAAAEPARITCPNGVALGDGQFRSDRQQPADYRHTRRAERTHQERTQWRRWTPALDR